MQGQKQQIQLGFINLCELENESTLYIGQKCTIGFLRAVQLELGWISVATIGQLKARISIRRAILTTNATDTKYEHAKVPETELGLQPRAGLAEAAMSRQEYGQRACGY
ncbi:MAG: hypothetical protein EZS28_010668 [Streblomastix strix]|uniref:Uncharacterized protein n=1 Tax=Streblomastix strix TaxID=222440 RepID=A0A5J4WGW8_9EUKA|nr:MAG: hypothetical protein EZS28_010668 [Streblomastix strix]